jgi:hypothetical protein
MGKTQNRGRPHRRPLPPSRRRAEEEGWQINSRVGEFTCCMCEEEGGDNGREEKVSGRAEGREKEQQAGQGYAR